MSLRLFVLCVIVAFGIFYALTLPLLAKLLLIPWGIGIMLRFLKKDYLVSTVGAVFLPAGLVIFVYDLVSNVISRKKKTK